jgi:glycosyltransferase involved in cell wall biosynthesis
MKKGVVDVGYPAQRVAVIPNSSDNDEFQFDAHAGREFRARRPWLGDDPLLVYTGTFGKVNGVGYMVELATALQRLKSGVKILLVGDGQERQSVLDAAREAGVYGENLFIEEKLPKSDIPALISAATMASSLFIDLPEMQSNSANKFFDALAGGTPVMLNYGGWMHDLVELHGCGLALWKKPIDEVAKIIDIKLYDEDWLQSAGEAARQLAESYFDRDNLARQLIEVLETTVNEKGRSPADIAPGLYR